MSLPRQKEASSPDTPPELPPREVCLSLWRNMRMIRAFEDQVRNLSSGGVIPGLVHLCAGQEAVAVGVCSMLGPKDAIASSHRGHGHCLAKGADMKRMMGEVMGRLTGYGLGRGGTLHIFDVENGILGTNGIVGGGIPLATGAALSAKRRGRGEVAACFFGDGALNQGLLFEVMNMAAIWRLPAVFVCENNGYGEFTAADDVTAGRPISRGAVFDISSEAVDGMDVLAVRAAAERAVTRARSGGGPSFLICTTYRYGGHHVGDKQTYKNEEEVQEWRRKDPIERLGQRLLKEDMATSADIADIEAEVIAEVRAAADYAKQAPFPDPNYLYANVYA